MEVLVDDKWILERMEMNYNREWYLIGKPYCGNRETILWKSGGCSCEGINFRLPTGYKGTFDRRKDVRSAFVLFLRKGIKPSCLL